MNTHASASRHRHLLTLALLASLSSSALAADVLAPSERASAPPGGGDANSWSRLPAISDDGRYTAFVSAASNLMPGDGNSHFDIFLYDHVANVVERMTVSTTGGASNGTSYNPSISGDGRFVSFEGTSSNLTIPAGNTLYQIYVRDRQTSTTQQASLSSTGVQGNQRSDTSQISNDGRFVVFLSWADNLVLGDTNARRDAFVRDLTGGTTMLVSIASFNGAQSNVDIYNPTISGNGRYVAYETAATNLIPGGTTPGRSHIYSYDTIGGATTLLSQSGGTQGNGSSRYPVFSDDGLFVAFHTDATNLVPPHGGPLGAIALLELSTGTLEQVNIDNQGNSMQYRSVRCALSSDARFVAMAAYGGVPSQDGGLYVRDRQLGLTIAASSTDDGLQPGINSALEVDISGDGTMVAMNSEVPLTAGDVLNAEDIYVRGIGAPAVYCVAKANSLGCQPSIGFTGEARVSNNYALTITCTNVLNNKNGLLLHGVGGPRQAPFQGGSLCVQPPFARSLLQNSGGNPPPNDCSGSWSANLGTVLAQSQIGPLVGLGTPIYVQWWGRDPVFQPPNNVQLSDALQIVVGP